MKRSVFLWAALLAAAPACSQEPVKIRVHAGERVAEFEPVWRFFGYDEPNYTYSRLGRKLITELSELCRQPVYFRTHNLLTTGDGTPALKWGSTNVYAEDASGKPVYDWTLLDRILDTYRDAGSIPFVEVGFMPKALSIHPEPYQHHWPKGTLWTGWAYPPKDYARWEELVRQLVLHCVQRYGREQVESWYWEVWNEPDIGYWQGTPEEYFKLYDYTAEALKRTLPTGRVGGPASTGPANPHAGQFLQDFLEHCDHGRNYRTGKPGADLDFISFHAKGETRMGGGQAEMGIGRHLQDISRGFEIIHRFEKFKALPVILSESDPEGCAACVASRYPQNGYRNTAQYASYEAEVLHAALELAERSKIHLAGLLTWAFEFEDQPYFAGYRTLATRGIDKPVLNAFRLLGLMGGERLRVESSGEQPLEALMSSELGGHREVSALAAKNGRKVSILIWNYSDRLMPNLDTPVDLKVEGLADAASRVQVQQYVVDDRHSNSFAAWKSMGSPQAPDSDQYSRLREAGQLQLRESPKWLPSEDGKIKLRLNLSGNSVSLVQVTW